MIVELTKAQMDLLESAAMRIAHGRSIWSATEAFAAEHLRALGLVTISANPKWVMPRAFATDEGRVWIREHFLGDMPMGRQSMDKKTILDEVEQVVADLKRDQEADGDASRRAFALMQGLQRHFDEMPVERVAEIREEFIGRDHGESFDEKRVAMANELSHFSRIFKDRPDVLRRIGWAFDDAAWRAVHVMDRRHG